MNKVEKKKVVFFIVFLLLTAFEGAVVIYKNFSGVSMQANQWLLGYSLKRWLIGATIGAPTLAFFCLAVILIISRSARDRILAWLIGQLAEKKLIRFTLPVLVFTSLVTSIVIFVFNSRLTLYLRGLPVYYSLFQPHLIWLLLFCLQAIAVIFWVFPEAWKQYFLLNSRHSAERYWFLIVLGWMTDIAAFIIIDHYDLGQIEFVPLWLTAGLMGLSIWNFLHTHYSGQSWANELSLYAAAIAVLSVSYIVFRMGINFTGYFNTPAKSYFNDLANAFLNGRLYLPDPGTLHDLTFYDGEWYVANPPLAALLMVPIVKLIGFEHLNTVLFSITFGSMNVSLVFLLLQRISRLGWTHLGTGDNLWLTALFGFGTANWYVTAGGTMSALSQVLTVTLVALAVLVMITRQSTWLSGSALALAMMARPNIVVIAPILLGIKFELEKEKYQNLTLKRFFQWAIPTGIPILLSISFLLLYNWARFRNPFDYGYLTENVADFMAADLQNYGTFHPVFILRNLSVMLFSLPIWSNNCQAVIPSFDGLSIFLVTPAIIYLVRSFKRTPWVIGTWVSIGCVLVTLMLYYNTGAWQFGYKYLLDFIVPVMMLLAFAAREKTSWFFKALILFSIAMQWYGTLWFYKAICRA